MRSAWNTSEPDSTHTNTGSRPAVVTGYALAEFGHPGGKGLFGDDLGDDHDLPRIQFQ